MKDKIVPTIKKIGKTWFDLYKPIFEKKPVEQPTPVPKLVPFSITRSDTARVNDNSRASFLAKYPLSWIVQHKYSPSDISTVQNSLGPTGWTLAAEKQSRISELGYAIGARRFGISIQKQLDEQVQRGQISVAERNYALASTTPVLGQYAPTYGWPVSP